MLYSHTAFALLCTLAAGSIVRRIAQPCPYHLPHDRPPIKDEYIVRLREGYSIDEHFGFLGKNLSQHATKFSHLQAVNSYTITIDEQTMHNGRFRKDMNKATQSLTWHIEIRYDPGVERVSPNMPFNPKFHWYDDIKEPEPRRHRKRWSTLTVDLDWWTRMAVKWDKQQSIIDGNKEKAVSTQD